MFGIRQLTQDLRVLREGQNLLLEKIKMVDANVAALKTGLDQVKQDVAAVAAELSAALAALTAGISADNEAAVTAAVAEIADIHTSLAALATPAPAPCPGSCPSSASGCMNLDYNESKDTYILRVPRNGHSIKALMHEHGLDFSTAASSASEAVLFTEEAYAAASFADCATERCRAKLGPILDEVAASWKSTSSSHYPVPEDKELWDFQRADIDYAIRRRNTLIGDQPGLGKTEVAIAFANEIKAKHILVICPANIRIQWAKRIQEWSITPSWSRRVHLTRKSKDGTYPREAGKTVWNIVSYDLARTEGVGRAITRDYYDLLILDEPHYLKES